MTTPLVPYRLTICGIEELCGHAAAGVTHVLTILDPGHPDPEVFATFGPHRRTVWRFHDIIGEGEDQTPPSEASVAAILTFGADRRAQGIDHLLVHCHMGISRSTACAAILLAQHNPGREADAFARIRALRPVSWPNSRMVRLADRLLERDGALVAAMVAHHRAVAGDYPDFARLLRQGERAHEVP